MLLIYSNCLFDLIFAGDTFFVRYHYDCTLIGKPPLVEIHFWLPQRWLSYTGLNVSNILIVGGCPGRVWLEAGPR